MMKPNLSVDWLLSLISLFCWIDDGGLFVVQYLRFKITIEKFEGI